MRKIIMRSKQLALVNVKLEKLRMSFLMTEVIWCRTGGSILDGSVAKRRLIFGHRLQQLQQRWTPLIESGCRRKTAERESAAHESRPGG